MTDTTRQQLLEMLGRTPSPTRRDVQSRAAVSYSLAVAWMLAVYVGASTLLHVASRPGVLTVVIALGLCVVAAVVTSAVLLGAASPLGRSQRTLAGFTLGVPLVVLAWLTFWEPHEWQAYIPAGWRCHSLSLAMGAALLVALAVVKRGSDPAHPNWLGAAFGAIAGAWAAVFVAAWCPLFDFSHAVLGHVAPIAVLSAAGAWLVSPLLHAARKR